MGFYKMPRTCQRFINPDRRQQYAERLFGLKNENQCEFDEEIELLPNIVRQSQMTIPMSNISKNAYTILKEKGLKDKDMFLPPDDLRNKIKKISGQSRPKELVNEHYNDQKKNIIPFILKAKSVEEIEQALKYATCAAWITLNESRIIKKFRIKNSNETIYDDSLSNLVSIVLKKL